jgi:hypothetical protein
VVGIVLGVSMAPTKVRMVLVEGENADGVTVDQEDFDVDGGAFRVGGRSTAPAEVISAILGTRQGAAEGGFELLSTGVTWTDHVEAAILRDALIAHKIENVMLVSAFMAAAALAQAVGDAIDYAKTALLFVEPYTATLAVVDTADGSVCDVHRRALADDEGEAVATLVDMVSGADALETHPEGLVIVGSGVDVPLIMPPLAAASPLELSVPDEPEMALARGAALASANAPLFASSTVALAYALDPGTGEVDPLVLAGQFPGLLPAYRPEYRSVSRLAAADAADVKDNVAYSAVRDEDAEAQTVIGLDESAQRRRSLLLVGSTLTVIFVSAVVALEIALAISIRPTVALRPSPNENIIVPAQPNPAPPVQAQPKIQSPKPMAAPRPLGPPAIAPPPAAPIPVIPPPVFIPRVPVVRPPGPGLGGDRGPFGGGHGPFGGRGPFGGGHGFGRGHGFGGGRGFGGFGHGFGGHGFGGFGHGFGGGGHGFGGFGRR